MSGRVDVVSREDVGAVVVVEVVVVEGSVVVCGIDVEKEVENTIEVVSVGSVVFVG